MKPSSLNTSPVPFPRILFVDHTAELGGAELSILDIARSVNGSSRMVLFEDDGPFFDRLQEANVATTVLRAGASLGHVRREGSLLTELRAVPDFLRLVWRLGRVARKYDVLLANSQKAMLVAALAGALARRPVVWYLRDLMSEAHFGAQQRRLAATTARLFVSQIIANSQASADALIASGGPPSRIQVVHDGIDERPFASVTDADVASVRRELNLPSSSGVVGVFSRLAEWKGQHVLLEALRSLPNVTALLVGEALFPEDQRYANHLSTKIERWGLSERVRMVGFRDDVPTLMKTCDAVLHTSTSPEPFGRVIVEGLMAERPVIATKEGGPSEILTDQETGLLIPADDPTALRTAIETVLHDRTTAAALARRGRALARSSFSTDSMVRQVRSIVEDVAAPPRTTAQ